MSNPRRIKPVHLIGFSTLLFTQLACATSLQLECKNKTQLSCASDAFKIDDVGCKDAVSYSFFDKQELSLIESGLSITDQPTDKTKAWLAEAEKKYSTCLAVNGQPAASADSWSNQLLVGYMFQSDYNDEGEHLGFEEQSAIAHVAFNGRWLYEDDTLLHWELGGILGKTAVNIVQGDSDSMDGDGSNMDDDSGSMDGNNNPIPADGEMQEDNNMGTPRFTDVDGSLDIYTKLTYTPTWAMVGNENTLSSYLTFGGLAGFRTRDVLTSESDGVIGYAGLIAEYYYFGKNVRLLGNDIPRGRVMFGPVFFEEYGGADDELRWVFTGEWNITGGSDGDIVIGVRANVGKGSDDIGIFAAVRKPLSSLKGFFGFGD